MGLLALALVLLSVLLPRPVAAAPAGSSADTRPVIVPGREAEITALFQPHAIGDELAPGWRLHSFGINVGTINVWIEGPETEGQRGYAQVSLDHLDHAPPGAQALTGFALQVIEQPPGSEAAVATLVGAITANDDGAFWGTNVVYAGEPREYPFGFELDHMRLGSMIELWLRDGLVFLLFVTAVLIVMAVDTLRGAPRWHRWALPGIVVLGAGLRVGLSPTVALAPWPYTRLLVPAGKIFHGPGLALLHPDPVWLSDVVTGTELAFSLLAPLAIFAHVRYLLDDHRAAIVAALVVAILPLHLRFSHSDAGFISSITISSTAFALVHQATRGKSKLGGWIALALVGFPIAVVYQLRPLNILYCPLLLATVFVDQGVRTDKQKATPARSIATFLVILLVTFGLGVPQLLEGFGDQVNEGMSLRTVTSALMVVVSPRLNALLNPVFSPPLLTLLAVWGAIDLWRRGRRRLFAFVVGWLLAFLIAHAYIIPDSMYMQARYHLHLIVPYMLLVACGADAGLRWLDDARARKPWLTQRRYQLLRGGALAYVLASPLIHLHGIRNVALNDVQEWMFVHEVREQIPAQCTVLEYTGVGAGPRFARVGIWIENGVQRERYDVVEILQAKQGEPELPDHVRALLEDPPACLYWYEGLPCFAYKDVSEPKAPVCRAIEGFVTLEEVAATRFASRPYDENLAFGLGELDQIELRLFRAYRKPE
ncbi:hypothetical protein DB30_02915 [Enhygromyxa salina]|uniref:Glycosyltransferase RgtA/B/C/D-like domain-containing protein n=1 Tax=Enhygromyxa salina TaxID=215803 RepID=A0A0C2D7Q1_9BACT|nr:hypothetical protein DB30_02915 [Enhygromyxa salina]